jgi:hypothetical protein
MNRSGFHAGSTEHRATKGVVNRAPHPRSAGVGLEGYPGAAALMEQAVVVSVGIGRLEDSPGMKALMSRPGGSVMPGGSGNGDGAQEGPRKRTTRFEHLI